MTRPVDLIVANVLHQVAHDIETAPPGVAGNIDWPSLHAAIARALLRAIAADASLAAVDKALAAAGVCGGVEGVGRRLSAVRELRAEEARAAAPPSHTTAHPPAPAGPAASGGVLPDAEVAGFVIPFPKAEG